MVSNKICSTWETYMALCPMYMAHSKNPYAVTKNLYPVTNAEISGSNNMGFTPSWKVDISKSRRSLLENTVHWFIQYDGTIYPLHMCNL